jgi:hypothetical protein
VTAGDVADPGNVGNAGDIVHAFLPKRLDLLVASARAPRGCACTMLGIFRTDGKREALAGV